VAAECEGAWGGGYDDVVRVLWNLYALGGVSSLLLGVLRVKGADGQRDVRGCLVDDCDWFLLDLLLLRRAHVAWPHKRPAGPKPGITLGNVLGGHVALCNVVLPAEGLTPLVEKPEWNAGIGVPCGNEGARALGH